MVGGGGGDTLLGGDGNDALTVQGSGFSLVDGGAGNDILKIVSAGSALNIANLVGKVTNIETLDMRDGTGTGLQLDLASILSLTDSRTGLSLRLDSGDTLELGGHYSMSASYADPTSGEQRVDISFYASATATDPSALVHAYAA